MKKVQGKDINLVNEEDVITKNEVVEEENSTNPETETTVIDVTSLENDGSNDKKTKIKQKKTKKSKDNPDGTKKKRKPLKKPYFIMLCAGLGVLGATLGVIGGYFVYTTFFLNPPVYKASYADFTSIRTRGDKNSNLTKEFKNEEYNIVNYSLDKFAHKKHTLSMGYGYVSSLGDAQVQKVKSVTIGGENLAYNQNVSSTSGNSIVKVNTAFRFYYDFTKPEPSIVAYEKKKASDWKDDMKSDHVYTFDDFIKSYGKLNIGSYSVDADGHYVGLEEKPDTFVMNGVSIYQINPTSVKNTKLESHKNGYTITMTLNTINACSLYVHQIQTNGDLGDLPSFSPTLTLSFELDKDYNLIESFAKENYKIKKGPLAVDVNSTMHTHYFSSDDEEFAVLGTNINVPNKGEAFPLDSQVRKDDKYHADIVVKEEN